MGERETWSYHVRSIRVVTVTITMGLTKCDVKINSSLLRTTKNEPRNCINIESNFGFESEPQVFGFSLSISY